MNRIFTNFASEFGEKTMSRRFALCMACWALVYGYHGHAPGAVIYSTDFQEPSFTGGAPVASQDGWNALGKSSAVTITSATPQSLKVDAALVGSTQTGAWRNTPVDTSTLSNKLIIMEGTFNLSFINSSSLTSWQFAGMTEDLDDFIGGFNIRTNGSVQLITAGFPTIAPAIARNSTNEYQVLFDFQSQTFGLLINGVTAATGVPFYSAQTVFGAGLFDTFGGGGTDFALLDHFAVRTVPEPTGMLLSGSGAAALLFLRGVRRKKRYPPEAMNNN